MLLVFQFQNPKFNKEIVVSIYQSNFQCPNTNFNNEVSVSILLSEFCHPNLSFCNGIVVWIVQLEFEFPAPSFSEKMVAHLPKFMCPALNFSFKVAVSKFDSELLSVQILISAEKVQFQYLNQNFSFQILI